MHLTFDITIGIIWGVEIWPLWREGGIIVSESKWRNLAPSGRGRRQWSMALVAGVAGCLALSSLLYVSPSSATGSKNSTKTTVHAASGKPILFGNISSINTPYINPQDLIDATRAYFAMFNKEGGVDGRPLKLVDCNDQDQAALALQCANDLESDGVVGLVSNWSLVFGTSALATIASDNIPVFGGWPITPAEYSSPVEFPVTAGGAGNIPGLSLALRSAGVSNLVMIAEDTAAAEGISTQVAAEWPTIGGTTYNPVYFNPTTTDYTSAAAAAVADGANGIILEVSSLQAVELLQSLQTVGFKGTVGGTGLIGAPSVQQVAGSLLDNVYLSFEGVNAAPATGVFATQFAQFSKLMKANDVPIDAQSVVGAAGAEYVYHVLKSMSPKKGYTKATVLAAAKKNTTWAGYLTHSMSPSFAPPGDPAIRNPFQELTQYEGNGKFDVFSPSGSAYSSYISTQDGVTFVAGYPVVGGSS